MHPDQAVIECARLIKESMLEYNSKTIRRDTILKKWKTRYPDQRTPIYSRGLGKSEGTIARKLIAKSCRKLEQDGIITRYDDHIVIQDIEALCELLLDN